MKLPDLPAYTIAANTLSHRAKVGQLFMPAAFINDTEQHIRILETQIRNHHIGGLCFFHSPESVATNFEGKRNIPFNQNSLDRLKQLVNRYQKAATYPLFIAVDAEWGLAMRMENTPRYPYALALGALHDDSSELLYELGLRMAADCLDAGINWNLCPVVDINTNPENPVIGYRAFGNRPNLVIDKSLPLLKGLKDGGVLTCIKHFPGHGDTDVDSHLDLPVLLKDVQDLQGEELLPFRMAIEAGAPAVMTGHLSVPALDPSGLPASLSERIVGMLREEMGFEGVVLTDALNMQALKSIDNRPAHINVKALQAGNDILCFASEIPDSIDLILETLPGSSLEKAFKRVWKLKENVFRKEKGLVAPHFTPQNLNWELAKRCLCEVGDQESSTSIWRKDGACLLYYSLRPDIFMDMVGAHLKTQELKWDKDQPISAIELPDASKLVLALQPPSMKPSENFGLTDTFFEELKILTAEKEVLLYLFGNPYLLARFPGDAFKKTICAFQPLEAMQKAAAMQYLGTIEAVGELPIDLKNAYDP